MHTRSEPEPKMETRVNDEIVNVEDEGDAGSEDKVGEGGDDVINIEQMEIEKERQARESLDNYLLETKMKADRKEPLLSVNNEAANNWSDDDNCSEADQREGRSILDKIVQEHEQENMDKFQYLITKYSQEGDIEGASQVLQKMKNQGIKINENMFNSLIFGNKEVGDMINVMNQWGLFPSLEIFLNLTLALGYAKPEDWKNLEDWVTRGHPRPGPGL